MSHCFLEILWSCRNNKGYRLSGSADWMAFGDSKKSVFRREIFLAASAGLGR